jgi:hypothetical protein
MVVMTPNTTRSGPRSERRLVRSRLTKLRYALHVDLCGLEPTNGKQISNNNLIAGREVSAPQLGGHFVSQSDIQTPSQNGISFGLMPFTAPHAANIRDLRNGVPSSPTPAARVSDANIAGYRRPVPPRELPETENIDISTDSSTATTATATTEDFSAVNITTLKPPESTTRINAAAAEFCPSGALHRIHHQTAQRQIIINPAAWNNTSHRVHGSGICAELVPPPPPSTPVQQPQTVGIPVQAGFYLHQVPQHAVSGHFIHSSMVGVEPAAAPTTNLFAANQQLQPVNPDILRALDGPTGNLQRLNLAPHTAPRSKELSRLLGTSGGIKIEDVMSDEFFPFVASPALGGHQVDWGVIKIMNVSLEPRLAISRQILLTLLDSVRCGS